VRIDPSPGPPSSARLEPFALARRLASARHVHQLIEQRLQERGAAFDAARRLALVDETSRKFCWGRTGLASGEQIPPDDAALH